MSIPEKMTIEHIRSRATEQSYARGQSYYQSSAVFDTVRRGNELEGYCEGSNPAPYHVRVILGSQGIESATCTCEYEWGGDCKHIVALLLTYVNRPESFEAREPVKDLLEQRSKDDLIALIRKMVERYPDLQTLIDLPTPGTTPRKTPLDTSSFRRELRRALNHYGGWGDNTAEFVVQSIAETAGEFAERGDWRSASAVYRTIVEECAVDTEYPDDEGEFVSAVNEVVEQLAHCLEQPELADDDGERQAILEALLTVYVEDTNLGGYGMGDEAPDYILRYARPPDFPAIRERVQAAQRRKAVERYGEWAVQDYAAFLIQLDALDHTDPEITLARLRDEALYSLLVGKLLEMGRVDEAIQVVEEHVAGAYERLAELPRLAAAGRQDDAIRLARETLQSGYDDRLTDWLLEQYQSRGDREACLELQRQRMLAAPSEQHYADLKAAAEALDRWPSLHPEIIRWLREKQHYPVLIKVYLHDQEWDAAWETLEKHGTAARHTPDNWAYLHLDLEVARQSGAARPRKAIPVFIKYARAEIAQRDRKHYQAAAHLLSTVRDLYRKIGDEVAWQGLIAGIRAEFPSLRALQDELKKAGL